MRLVHPAIAFESGRRSNTARTCVLTASVPARVCRRTGKGQRCSPQDLARVRATRRRNTSPVAISRNPPPPSGPYASDDTSGTFALASCADACASSSCSPRHHGVKLVICPHACRKGLPLPRVAVRNAESTDVGPKVDRHLGSVLPKVRRGELAVGT